MARYFFRFFTENNTAHITGMSMGDDNTDSEVFLKFEYNYVRLANFRAKHTTRVSSLKSLTDGVQGPLKGPGSSGYFALWSTLMHL